MSTLICVKCRRNLDNEYYTLAEKLHCKECRERLDPTATGSSFPQLVHTLYTAITLAILGGLISAAIDYATGYTLGIVWLFIGSVVGLNIRIRSGRQSYLPFRLLAVASVYLAMGLSLAITAVWQAGAWEHMDAERWRWLIHQAVLLGPIELARADVIFAFIYGYGLFLAWKSSGPSYLAFRGPLYTHTGQGSRFCEGCQTVLGTVLSCQHCGRLVHQSRLDEIERAADLAGPDEARKLWEEALDLVHPESEAAQKFRANLGAIQRKHESQLANLGLFGLFVWKAKSIFLGLLKLPTLLTMVTAVWAYGQLWGWPFALGFILCIYLHEMGHVLEIRKLGLHSDAPVFLPGLGAVVMLRERSQPPEDDARIGLAGPHFGLYSVLLCWAAGWATGNAMFFDLRASVAAINLFNLVPLWPLDGGRGIRPLNRSQRLWLLLAGAVLWTICEQSVLLLLFCAMMLFQSGRNPAPGAGHPGSFWHFLGLLASLTAFLRPLSPS